ncbi:VanZ family protein [Leifsonia xyli]|nr:VanZ family protein [Leifsonia xyli]
MFSRLLFAVTALYLLAVAWITLKPSPPDPHRNSLFKGLLMALAESSLLSWIDAAVLEFVANIFLFVPLGVLLTLWLGLRRWWLVLALGAATTLTIEFAQLFIPDRVSDLRDLLANTLGTAFGIAAVAVAARLRRGRRTRRNRLSDSARP